MNKYTRLFEPIKVGKMQLRNRIGLSEMAAGGDKDGVIAQRSVDFYVKVARGGAALVMVGPGPVAVSGASSSYTALLEEDRCIPALAEMARRVHEASPGVKIGMQLFHVGLQKHSSAKGAQPGKSVSPSPFHYKWDLQPTPLTTAEVEQLVQVFVEAARRLWEAGLDCVGIHGAHGYLVSEFLSPYTNKRTDKYGGSAENRARFACEIIQGIKKRCGADFPVILKVNGEDFLKDVPDRITPAYMKTLVPWFEKAGADAIVVSSGTHDSFPGGGNPSPYMVARGQLVESAAEIKKAATVPIATCNRVDEPEIAERILKEGKVDLVWMGRALVADPEYPNKLASGREDEIRRCIACNTCIDMLWDEWFCDWKCAVNPESFREELPDIVPMIVPKDVLVIGGGPAGCEAARVAALAGNRVTLWEKEDRLGGQLNLASLIPDKQDFASLTRYYSVQLKKLGVNVELGKTATVPLVLQACPNVVIIATGSRQGVPPIPGVKQKIVVNARDVISGAAKTGNKVVIIGGGSVGMETAQLLCRNGKKVTIVEALPKLGKGMVRMVFQLIRLDIKQRGVEWLTSAKVKEISGTGVSVIDRDGKERFIEADSVVMATGAIPDRDLFNELRGPIPEVHLIGDSLWPRNIMSAIYQGAMAARTLDDYQPLSY